MKNRSREEIAEELSMFEAAVESNPDASQREIIEQLGLPRSTLRHWLNRKESIDAAPEVINFFESPAGTAFLHRLVLAAHFVFTINNPCGIRPICQYLELTGLNKFVASSYGSQQKVSVSMEEESVEFGRKETKRLAAKMSPKKVSITEDETFHPETCLVAIELVSNFILLEKYASGRKAGDWTSAFKEATKDLDIEVVQCASDEGRGLVSHVTKDLKAHHSPDLFHIQQEIIKGTSIVLESRKKKADKALAEASEEVNRHKEAKSLFHKGKRPVGRAPDFDKRIQEAQKQENNAKEALEKAENYRESVKQAVKGIGDSYHPYGLETGIARSPEEVSCLLENHFSTIEKAASESSLPERCIKKIKKAKRMAVKMTANLVFFFCMIRAKIDALSLSSEMEQVVYNQLIPGIYLDIVSKKAKTKEQRDKLRKKSEEILIPIKYRDGPLKSLSQDDIMLIENAALECAQLFQRSSSCVEGRNGHLSLYHHSLHRLSDRKLEALTTVHNFFRRRRDGTTPAERLFGSKPEDMFEWLLKRIDLSGRPAQKRPLAESGSYLYKYAA